MFNVINSRIKITSTKFAADSKLSKLLEQSVPVLIGIFIFFNPFPHTTAIKEISFYLSVFMVFILIISKKTDFYFKTPLILPFGFFVSWTLLSIFFAIDKENSIHDFYSHLLRYIILYHIIINFFNSKKRLIHLSWVIVSSSAIFILGGLFYHYFILGESLSSRFGIFEQASVNIVGVITVFAFILTLNQLVNETHFYAKGFLAFLLITLFLGLLMTQTRSSLIGLFLGVIYYLQSNKKWGFVFLILMLIMCATVPVKNRYRLNNPTRYLRNIRIGITYLTIEVIKE